MPDPRDRIQNPPPQTVLPPERENLFQKWRQLAGMFGVFDPELQYTDGKYDTRGMFNKFGPLRDHLAGRDHGTDLFKLPGHPTFSNESVYATPENYGGRWFPGDVYVPQLATSRIPVNSEYAGQLGASMDELLWTLLNREKK